MMDPSERIADNNIGAAHKPKDQEQSLIEWRHFNYTPDGEADTTPGTGLSAKFELRTEGVLLMKVRCHPWTPVDSLAMVLDDLAVEIRKDLNSKTPILTIQQRLHEIDTSDNSPTPPATFTGKAINNLLETALNKLNIAMEFGYDELIEKYFAMGEKLYEWQCNNYTPEAIENGPRYEHI